MEIRKTFDYSQKESSDSRFESSATHGALVLVSKLDIYMGQHRKVTHLHTWVSSNDSLLKYILSYAAILRDAPDWTVVKTL